MAASGLLSLCYYGIDSIATEIENPFGWDENDHDLTHLGCQTLKQLLQIARAEQQSYPQFEQESKSSRRDSSASIESNSPVSFRKKKKGKHATRKKVKKARMDTVAAQDSVEELSVQKFLADEETAEVEIVFHIGGKEEYDEEDSDDVKKHA